MSIASSRGQHHDRDVGERPDLAEDLEAVHVRQADVEQHDVRVLVLDDVQGGLAGPGAEDLHLAPLEGEPEPDRLHDVRLVVDDQDAHQAGSGGPSAGTTRVKVLPWPGRLSTSIVPPCAWAIASAVGSPSPTPSAAECWS